MKILALVLALCDPGEALLNSTLWMQSAAEYRAASLQTYAIARQTLDAAWRTGNPACPDRQDCLSSTAIVLDIDETIFDNSRFAARQLAQGKTFTFGDEWTAYVNEIASAAVPGSVEFLQYAKSRGVTPVYITNRTTIHKAATLQNLAKLGFPFTEDDVLVREDSSTDKTARRNAVAARYRIVMYVGDAMSDFPSSDDGVPRIFVPNPVYGSWEKNSLTPDAPPPLPSRSPCDDSRSGKSSR